MKYILMLFIIGAFGCKSSSGGSDPTPTPAPACQTLLQPMQLNDALPLTDLDSTAIFVKNNAQQLQRLEAEQAAAVWDCLEKEP